MKQNPYTPGTSPLAYRRAFVSRYLLAGFFLLIATVYVYLPEVVSSFTTTSGSMPRRYAVYEVEIFGSEELALLAVRYALPVATVVCFAIACVNGWRKHLSKPG